MRSKMGKMLVQIPITAKISIPRRRVAKSNAVSRVLITSWEIAVFPQCSRVWPNNSPGLDDWRDVGWPQVATYSGHCFCSAVTHWQKFNRWCQSAKVKMLHCLGIYFCLSNAIHGIGQILKSLECMSVCVCVCVCVCLSAQTFRPR